MGRPFACVWCAVVAALSCPHGATAQPASTDGDVPQALALVGGVVFDGERFERRDVFVHEGQFVRDRPAEVDTVLDVSGGFLVPPYGDFHSHVLASPWNLEAAEARYLREGTFYVQNMTDAASQIAIARSRFEAPGTLDVAYALGGFTSTNSHPQILIESYAQGLNPFRLTPEERTTVLASRTAENDSYWLVDPPSRVAEVWPQFMAGQPDLVKVYLLDVAAGLAAGDMAGHGLHPDVLVEVVRHAHDADLRVLAHVETAQDVQLALDAGVDGFVHLPGYAVTAYAPARYDTLAASGWRLYHLDDATVKRLAERQSVVSPTVFLASTSMRWNYPDRPARLTAVRARQWDTLRRLKAAGVRVTIGLDSAQGTTWAEADYMATHGLFSPAEMLQMWATETPQAIFPDRQLGEIREGYEGSLLVLNCDPLETFSCTQDIRVRLKDGLLLPPMPPASDE
ncbi:MAG: amidohydrolase family protein [Bacteroidota bacterium]